MVGKSVTLDQSEPGMVLGIIPGIVPGIVLQYGLLHYIIGAVNYNIHKFKNHSKIILYYIFVK